MSAVRRNSSRSNRSALSSPYARPAKKSSWTLSGFLSYLNPLRSRGSAEEEYIDSDEGDAGMDRAEFVGKSPSSPAQTLSRRGHQLTGNIATDRRDLQVPPPPPPSNNFQNLPQRQATSSIPQSSSGVPSAEFTFKISSSPAKNLDTVSSFLSRHANQPISSEDINQMVALIQQSKPGVSPSNASEKDVSEGQTEEPFRFESRAATTPPRSKSPSAPPRSSSTAPRTLTRNPNGSYTWKGAGSARAHRARNSFSSPAFRTPRSSVRKAAPSTTEVTGNDAKRRRVGDSITEPQSSTVANGTPQNQVPFPVTSTPTTSRTTATGPSLKPPTVSTPVRQRTPGLSKPTAPVVPSPLRQAWTGGSPSGSESGSPQGPSTLRKTETAKHVTELVNSLKSHDKVLDELRNPYEVANPVKRPTVSKRKRVTAPAKKPQPAGTPKEDETTKVRVRGMSAHAIIEATLPEGSKRSRPPPELERPTSQIKESQKVTVAETTEEEEIRVPKRSKPLVNGHAAKEATADVDMQPPQLPAKEKEKPAMIKVPTITVPPQPSSTTKTLFGPKSSLPKEPSKLRFSMQAESTSTPPSPVPEPKVELESAPKSVPHPPMTFVSPAAPLPVTTETKKEITPATDFFSAFAPAPLAPRPAPATLPVPQNAKEKAKAQPLASLPTFTFTCLVPSASSKAQDEAKVVDRASLPTFDLTKSVTSTLAPAPSQKTNFDWGAAGLKAPATGASTEWKCDSCMLNNPASATEKCTICDAPKAGVKPPTPAPSFNWGAAGIKPVAGPSNGEWTCSQCSLQNPAGATVKCTICDAPKPGTTAEPPQPAPSFNWGAAGIKSMTGPADGEWSCSQCSLKNSSTATEKCTICDAPKSGATVASVPKATGFNWGAVGLKAPTSNGSAAEWTCGLCGLKNPADAKAKCTICDAPRS